MSKKRQKIEIKTDGTYRNTELSIDGHKLYFESLYLSGGKEDDFEIILGLTLNKSTKEQIKNGCNQPAVEFEIPNELEEYDDEE